MSVEEKAKELVEKFIISLYFPNNVELKDVTITSYNVGEAKQCALITCDEVINEMTYGIGRALAEDRYNYWQEVKEEIEKL